MDKLTQRLNEEMNSWIGDLVTNSDLSCETCKCNTCKMNENGGIYGGCCDCENCKEQNLYCEDCSMYEYDKYRLSN